MTSETSRPGGGDSARSHTKQRRLKQRRLLPDLTPWRRSRDFRLLWSSGLITRIGSICALVAMPLQAKQLTGSAVAVGAIGGVELVPILIFGLYGGSLADVVDRRKLALLTEIGLGIVSALLLLNALLPRPALWPLYAAAIGASALQGLQQPASQALLPRLVPHDQLTAAMSLISVQWTVSAVVGPAIGGLLVVTLRPSTGYAVDTATFAGSVLLLFRLRPVPPTSHGERPSWPHVRAGFRYAASRPDLIGTYATDMAAMFFALPTAVFPFLADDLHAPWALGLLYTAPSVGNLLATLTSGWTARTHRHGRLVLIGFAVWGAGVAAAGLTDRLWLALIALAVAGAGNFVADLFRVTIWNASVPDELRGRLAGIELLTSTIGPSLGDVRAGLVTAGFGARTALSTGGWPAWCRWPR
ncbi:MAG TPA: MFS transporter [Pseudonocardiaceae bacterium]|nr:MFS transporter [Pseudonocardiaceae bacterium]